MGLNAAETFNWVWGVIFSREISLYISCYCLTYNSSVGILMLVFWWTGISEDGVVSLMMISSGVGMIVVGGFLTATSDKVSIRQKVYIIYKKCLLFTLYPFIILLSPAIFLFIRFMKATFSVSFLYVVRIQSVLRPDNMFIRVQAKRFTLAESILESTPQLCLQVYVILLTMDPRGSQIFSMATSALSLSLANIDKFLVNSEVMIQLTIT